MARTGSLTAALALALASCSDAGTNIPGGGGHAGTTSGGNGAGTTGATTSGGNGASSGGTGGTPDAGSGGASMPSSGGSASGSGGAAGSGATDARGGSTTTLGGAGTGAGGQAGKASGGAAGTPMGGGAGTPSGMPTEAALPALRTVRQEHGVAALRGEVYVVGGYTPSVTATVEAYDPRTMTWRAVKDFVTSFQHANVAAAADKLFVLGFYLNNNMGAATDQAYAYDPDADTWTTVASLPTGTQRGAACTAVLNDKIYLFGGARNGTSVRDAAVYDPLANSWQELPALPTPREHCAAGAIAGKVYVVGGRANGISGFEPSTLEFDPASPGYVQKKPIPTPRGGIAAAVLGGKLFVFGGEGSSEDANGVFPDIEAYDPVTDTWTAHPPMKSPRHGFGAATLDDRVYLMGGANRQGFGAVNTASVFSLE